MKRLFIAILCLALLSLTAYALLGPEEEETAEVLYCVEPIPVSAYVPAPEEIFLLEKQIAQAEYLLPEEDRLLPYVPQRWTEDCVIVLSRMVWGEARGVSRNEQKLVVWTVINRLENGRYGNSLIGVVRARGQFHGYSPQFPVTDEIREMVVDVLLAWDRGEEAKVYPPFAQTSGYLYFHGDGRHNWFRARY